MISSRSQPPSLLSRTHPFITLHASNVDGPRTRHRLVWRGGPVPDWLTAYAPYGGLGQSLIVVTMGRARLGSSTRIQSVVVYPARPEGPEMAYVYVEETQLKTALSRNGHPIHVVRCAPLPKEVRFVEVTPAR